MKKVVSWKEIKKMPDSKLYELIQSGSDNSKIEAFVQLAIRTNQRAKNVPRGTSATLE